jgi:hypothetical protein
MERRSSSRTGFSLFSFDFRHGNIIYTVAAEFKTKQADACPAFYHSATEAIGRESSDALRVSE